MDDLRKIAADLREARRYVGRDIGEARKQADLGLVAMHAARRGVDAYASLVLERLGTNLSIGLRFALVSPELLRSYLGNCAFEIEVLAGPIEVLEVDAA